MSSGVDAESLKCCEHDENSGPPVVKREWEVDENLISHGRRGVMLFNDVINVRDCGGNKERKDKRPNVMVVSPQGDIDSIQKAEEGETPGNGVDDHRFARREELIDDGSKQKQMDQRPNEERPGGGTHVCFLAIVIASSVRGDGVDVGAEEKAVNNNIDDLEENAVLPGGFFLVVVVERHIEGDW